MMAYHQSSSHTQSAESSTNPSPLPPKARRGRAPHKVIPKKPMMINHDTHAQQQCHGHGHGHGHDDDDDHHHEYNHEYLHACLLCPKKFTTSQALGGHQNAHRKERHNNKPFVMNNFQEEIGENDIVVHHHHHQHDHHHRDHHDHHHDHSHHHGHQGQGVLSPNPLRTIFPLTEYQKVDVTPPNYNNYGINYLLNPITLTNWAPPPLPSPAYALPHLKPYYYHHLPLGLVAQVVRSINPDLGRAQAQTQITQPLFPTSTNDVNADDNQNVALVEDNNEIIKTCWGLDLKLAL